MFHKVVAEFAGCTPYCVGEFLVVRIPLLGWCQDFAEVVDWALEAMNFSRRTRLTTCVVAAMYSSIGSLSCGVTRNGDVDRIFLSRSKAIWASAVHSNF